MHHREMAVDDVKHPEVRALLLSTLGLVSLCCRPFQRESAGHGPPWQRTALPRRPEACACVSQVRCCGRIIELAACRTGHRGSGCFAFGQRFRLHVRAVVRNQAVAPTLTPLADLQLRHSEARKPSGPPSMAKLRRRVPTGFVDGCLASNPRMRKCFIGPTCRDGGRGTAKEMMRIFGRHPEEVACGAIKSISIALAPRQLPKPPSNSRTPGARCPLRVLAEPMAPGAASAPPLSTAYPSYNRPLSLFGAIPNPNGNVTMRGRRRNSGGDFSCILGLRLRMGRREKCWTSVRPLSRKMYGESV